jgi:hypothetical protein
MKCNKHFKPDVSTHCRKNFKTNPYCSWPCHTDSGTFTEKIRFPKLVSSRHETRSTMNPPDTVDVQYLWSVIKALVPPQVPLLAGVKPEPVLVKPEPVPVPNLPALVQPEASSFIPPPSSIAQLAPPGVQVTPPSRSIYPTVRWRAGTIMPDPWEDASKGNDVDVAKVCLTTK